MPLQEETRVPPQFLPLSIARAVWKRKLWVLLVWTAVSAITFVWVMRLPSVYRAESLILIEGQRIPERYVPATVNDELSNRLSMLTQQIKSYVSLLETVEKFDLYRDERKTMVEEEIIARMRADVDIKVVQGWSRDTFPAFTISYQGTNPVLVAQVADWLTTKFYTENLKLREGQAKGTQQFLDSQLDQARVDLEEQERVLKDFRQRYHGELPAQTSALMGRLNRLELQLKGVQDSLRNAEQQKVMLANSLASAQNSLATFRELSSQGLSPAQVGRPGGGGTGPPSDLQRAQAVLAGLRLRYSEDHPDVTRIRAQIQIMEQAAAAGNAAAEKVAAEPVADAERESEPAPAETAARPSLSLATMLQEHEDRVRNIQVQTQLLTDEETSLQKEKARILGDMADSQRRVEALPLVDQEFAKVTRDYDNSRANYHKLLNQKKEADLAFNMETLQKAERFVILDKPRVPSKPIKPKREALIGMGCVGGLALGVLLGFALELRRGVLLGEWELPEGYTVLGRVPPIRLAVAGKQERFAPPQAKRSRWPKARVTVRLRSPAKRLVVAPTILLCVLCALVATSIYTGWSPF
jgi:polysaccharide chain length determinant protein (PEP-CTERM system associated)